MKSASVCLSGSLTLPSLGFLFVIIGEMFLSTSGETGANPQHFIDDPPLDAVKPGRNFGKNMRKERIENQKQYKPAASARA